MDLYLVYKKDSHKILQDPTEADMEGAEVLFRRLDVGCRANMDILDMMNFAIIDIIYHLAEIEMRPDRVTQYNERIAAFSHYIPAELKVSWEICQARGLAALTSQKAVPEIC